MPGKSKPSSEYKKKFRWHDSHLSYSFKPAPDQVMPSAGIPSVTLGKITKESLEPPLQQRRKPLDNEVKRTYTTSHFYNPTPSGSDDGSLPQSSKPPSSKQAAVHHHKSTTLRSPTNGHTERHHSSPGHGHKEGYRSSPGGGRYDRILAKNDQNKRNTSGPKDDKHKTYSKLTNGHHPRTGASNGHHSTRASNGRSSSGGSRSRDGHRSSNDSGRSSKKPHDVDAALQYQAGIRARPLGPRYLSEYQRQFEWKQTPKESPLIAADELIHKSNTNIAPFDPSKIPKKTEYNTQFKAYYPPAPSSQQQLQENVEREMKAKYKVKTKSKKTKKNPLSPEQLKTAGKPSVIVHEEPEHFRESQNPQKPFFPHASVRKWKSEYHSNFKPPSMFSYEDGVWRGANPPHMHPQDSSSDSGKQGRLRHAKSEGDIPSWFAEVLELRNRAQEYQKRAQGTHFSRERLAQLWSEGARLATDDSSTAVSTSSLTTSSDVHEEIRPNSTKATHGGSVPDNDSHSHAKERQPGTRNDRAKTSPSGPSPVRRKLAWEAGRKGDTDESERRSSYGSIPTPDGYSGSVSNSSDDFRVLSEDGRLPTPKLDGQQTRHHLDKTTPAAGGAILSSPPRRKQADIPARASTAPGRGPPPFRSSPPHRTSPPRTAPAQRVSPPQKTNGYHRPIAGVGDVDSGHANGHHHPATSRGTGIAKPIPERVTTILPGGVSKAFEYDSDDQDEVSSALTSTEEEGAHDRTLTPPRTPTKGQFQNRDRVIRSLQTSPTAGKTTRDPDPLSPGPDLPFQRHSNNFFETHPNIPLMQRRDEPPSETWAHPRIAEHARPFEKTGKDRTENGNHWKGKTYNMKEGPLNRPNSGSLHGRPMTAHPQTRQNAARESSQRISPEDRPNSFISSNRPNRGIPPRNNSNSANHREAQDSDDLSLSAMSTSSSISLASEVLDRAKKRRDDFWGKKMR